MDYPLVMVSRAAGHRTRKLAMRLLDEVGLFPGQEVVLLELDARGPLNQAELATALDVEPPSVTSIVSKLEASGLVSRTVRGREKVVALTDTGRRAAGQAREVYARMEALLSRGWDAGGVQTLVQALETISDAAGAALRSEH